MTAGFEPSSFFDLSDAFSAGFFPAGRPVWAALEDLGNILIEKIGEAGGLPGGLRGFVGKNVVLWKGEVLESGFETPSLDAAKGRLAILKGGKPLEGASLVFAGAFLDGPIHIGEGVMIEPGAMIRGPAFLRGRCEVRQGAYVRGNLLAGFGSVIGHATEVKNAIFLEGAKAGHFAYAGDSILGKNVNLGAGTKLANLKIIGGMVKVPSPSGAVDTGRRKLGAILGDGCETGCNSVTSPGAFLMPGTLVYPNTTVPPGLHADKKRFK